jgi:hypothetical protein
MEIRIDTTGSDGKMKMRYCCWECFVPFCFFGCAHDGHGECGDKGCGCHGPKTVEVQAAWLRGLLRLADEIPTQGVDPKVLYPFSQFLRYVESARYLLPRGTPEPGERFISVYEDGKLVKEFPERDRKAAIEFANSLSYGHERIASVDSIRKSVTLVYP